MPVPFFSFFLFVLFRKSLFPGVSDSGDPLNLGLYACPNTKVGDGILAWFLPDPFKSFPPQTRFLSCLG